MISVVVYKYEVNALYVVDELHKKGVSSEVHEKEVNKRKFFEVLVPEEDLVKCQKWIKTLEIDDTTVDPESDGAIEGLKEWNDKMYVSGYFTGGRMPFYWTKIRNKYFEGTYVLVLGFIFLIAILIASDWNIELSILLPIIYIALGFSILYNIKRKKK